MITATIGHPLASRLCSLAPLAELRTLTCSQLHLCCRRLAGAGASDHEIAWLVGWGVTDVRRAISAQPDAAAGTVQR